MIVIWVCIYATKSKVVKWIDVTTFYFAWELCIKLILLKRKCRITDKKFIRIHYIAICRSSKCEWLKFLTWTSLYCIWFFLNKNYVKICNFVNWTIISIILLVFVLFQPSLQFFLNCLFWEKFESGLNAGKKELGHIRKESNVWHN